MKTRAVRLYGKNDLRLEEFELPAIREDEILAKVVCDSICMSTYKASTQADVHKRVPRDVAENPVIVGHEFAGEIVEVGARYAGQFAPGDRFAIQPALNDERGPVGIWSSPGYSYPYIGGDATYVIIPPEVMDNGALLKFTGEGFYRASLAEPLSCVAGAMHANYHTSPGVYTHDMDIREGGNMAVLAGVGPMGLAMINYALNRERKPGLMVVTDIDAARLARAEELFSVEYARERGIKLIYLNTGAGDPVAALRALTDGGRGFDDVFVMAPVAAVIEQGDGILAQDGCLNFFAGPSDTGLKAKLNFYGVHYGATHVTATSGGNSDDMCEVVAMIDRGLDPAGLVTHIGGLDAVAATTLDLPKIPGGKKLIYTHIEMPLTAIADFAEKGRTDSFFAELDRICRANRGLWSVEAENYLLANKQ